MTSFKTQAHIHSLDGAMDEITVLDSRQDVQRQIQVILLNHVDSKILQTFVGGNEIGLLG